MKQKIPTSGTLQESSSIIELAIMLKLIRGKE